MHARVKKDALLWQTANVVERPASGHHDTSTDFRQSVVFDIIIMFSSVRLPMIIKLHISGKVLPRSGLIVCDSRISAPRRHTAERFVDGRAHHTSHHHLLVTVTASIEAEYFNSAS